METLSRKKYSFIHPSKKYLLRTYVPRTVKHHTLCALVFLVPCPPGFLQGCLGHKRFTPVTDHTHSDTCCVLSSTGLTWGRQAFSMWSLLLKDSHSCWTFSELSHSWEGWVQSSMGEIQGSAGDLQPQSPVKWGLHLPCSPMTPSAWHVAWHSGHVETKLKRPNK